MASELPPDRLQAVLKRLLLRTRNNQAEWEDLTLMDYESYRTAVGDNLVRIERSPKHDGHEIVIIDSSGGVRMEQAFAPGTEHFAMLRDLFQAAKTSATSHEAVLSSMYNALDD